MEVITSFVASIGGLVVGGLVVAFLIGWLLLRRSARKLKKTT